MNDIFAVQDEISEAIVNALKLKLLPEEKKAIENRSTVNPEAYKLYLMARKFNATGNARHRPISIRLCERAVKIDPGYARAWALLAICKSNDVMTARGTGDSGWSAAERALELDPKLAEAHAARGRVLGDDGRLDESLEEHMRAMEIDPDNYEVNAAAARCFVALRRYQEAIHCLERAAVAIETDFWSLGVCIQCHEALGDSAGMRSAAERALERVERIIVTEPDHGGALGFGVMALATLGQADRAREWADRAILLDPENANLHYNMGCAMVSLRDFDKAIELLEMVFANAKTGELRWFATDSALDPIRQDSRYKALVAAAEKRLSTPP